MSEIDINSVLGQMRAMAAQAQIGVPGTANNAASGVNFSKLLADSINKVNDVQMEAGRMSSSFESGDPQTDLTQVMISLQKASVSFQAMTQVRNKLVDAYKDIMNMPV